MKEKNYERVNWQARKTPLSAANFNIMDEGIETNRKAIQEIQMSLYGNEAVVVYEVEAVVETRSELPKVPVNGAYYYVSSTNSIYKGVGVRYELEQSTVKQINGGGAI
jgi:hypothetical protein